ncbi:MAG: ABC transporter substrate-binding protein [Chloroflexi bacterium]|nr:ABC transporter substrate-binding protein [Chloroflexota bacterium]
MPAARTSRSASNIGRGARLVAALLLASWLLAGCGGATGQRGTPGGASTTAGSTARSAQEDPQPLLVGLDAAMSGGSAASGEAIRRGLQLAIDEINGQGGIHGHPLQLVVRDHEGNPTKGVANIRELVERQGVVAIFAGLHTPVAMAERDIVHQLEVPFIVPWAAGTQIVQNGRNPNFIFRVSANDWSVDQFLVNYVVNKLGKRNPAVLVEDTAWGESNIEGLTHWLAQAGLRPAVVEKFKWGDTDMTPQLTRAREAGADAIILVANAPEGAQVMRSMDKLGLKPTTIPVVTHWGVTGGQFAQVGGFENTNDVRTVQTYTFFGELNIPGKRVLSGYLRTYGGNGPEDITAPVGVANAFDALHILARALRQVDDPHNGDAVRRALEDLQQPYEGLIKTYTKPFSPTNHEALTADDYVMTVWQDGKLVPEPK